MLFLQLCIQLYKVLLQIVLVWLNCFNTLSLKALSLISKLCRFFCLPQFPLLSITDSLLFLISYQTREGTHKSTFLFYKPLLRHFVKCFGNPVRWYPLDLTSFEGVYRYVNRSGFPFRKVTLSLSLNGIFIYISFSISCYTLYIFSRLTSVS